MVDNSVGRGPQGRRSFTMAFKYDIVRQWDQCVERGAKIRLLREHNLDPNTVRAWVRARDALRVRLS